MGCDGRRPHQLLPRDLGVLIRLEDSPLQCLDGSPIVLHVRDGLSRGPGEICAGLLDISGMHFSICRFRLAFVLFEV